MKTVRDIMDAIERLAPKSLADAEDNVGLLVGWSDAPVFRVLVSLDADMPAIEEAIEKNVDLIVTHHPIIFNPIKSVTEEKLLTLIENKVAVYAAHTNLDWADGGVNDTLAARLGVRNARPLVIGSNGSKMARVGEIEKTTLYNLVTFVNKTLGGAIKYVGDKERLVGKVALCGGAGGYFLLDVIKEGCDVYISSDFRHHEAITAETAGICLIDAGHFETENVVVEVLANYIKKEYNDIEVLVGDRRESQFKYE